MSTESYKEDHILESVIRGAGREEPKHSDAPEQPLDHATEVAHAWAHFFSDCRFFAVFFAIIVLTVATFLIDFGPAGNKFFIILTAVMRCGLIAYYMLTLFKSFSLVKSTFIFSAIFLIGMIFLSWWDSELPHIGNPIKDRVNPPPYSTGTHEP